MGGTPPDSAVMATYDDIKESLVTILSVKRKVQISIPQYGQFYTGNASLNKIHFINYLT